MNKKQLEILKKMIKEMPLGRLHAQLDLSKYWLEKHNSCGLIYSCPICERIFPRTKGTDRCPCDFYKRSYLDKVSEIIIKLVQEELSKRG